MMILLGCLSNLGILGLSESDTRAKLIDPKMREAGWDENQIQREAVITHGAIIDAKGNRRPPRFADYILFHGGMAIAIVEAKEEDEDHLKGMKQAKDYCKMYGAMFAFSSNGHKIEEFDFNSNKQTTLESFPSPEELYRRYIEGRFGELHSDPFPRDRIMGNLLKTKKQQLTKAYDLIVAEIDAKMGGFGVIPPELENAIVSNHYFLYELNDKIVEPEFLAFYISTGKPTTDIQGFVKGSHNYASVRPEHFLELDLPVPSLIDQHQLIELRRKVADLNKIHTSIREAADLMIRSTYESVFEGKNLLTTSSINPSEAIED